MRLKHVILSLVAVFGVTHAASTPNTPKPEMEVVEKDVTAFPGAVYAAPSHTTTTTFGPTGWRKVWQNLRHPLRWAKRQWIWLKTWRSMRAQGVKLSLWTGRRIA